MTRSIYTLQRRLYVFLYTALVPSRHLYIGLQLNEPIIASGGRCDKQTWANEPVSA